MVRCPYQDSPLKALQLKLGQALVGALLKGCLDRDIEPQLNTKTKRLIKDGNRITGIEIEVDNKFQIINARRGVIIATGGFEWNKDLVSTFLRGLSKKY